MQGIKIFSDHSLFDIESSVNAWLTINPKIEVLTVVQSSYHEDHDDDCELLHSITIVYKAA
ncbi:MAG: hypothetical protein M3004_02955 [Bacteroidota bacterium]|nr:hypothetical protein [Bacteroidota bacterium]